ncbi:MAG: ABC transporter substrate-binding protein [Bacteroidia bacterium]|nr:ABC transporter substrate-binding protein [Bacteroidia bacterium]
MPLFTDQIGHHINFEKTPTRIVSIVPSQSEFLWDIGLREELVGITRFCIHPEEMYKKIERVGGTKELNLEKIRLLKPDLIIGNKEENSEEQIRQLQEEFPVWMSDIYSFEDSFKMMHDLGIILEKEREAKKIVADIKKTLPKIKNKFSAQTLAYFIWNKPYMLAAKNTFIDYVINYIGFTNACASLERYPEMTDEELVKLNPELCFLSSEPFPFKEKHVEALQTILPKAKIRIVDGEIFSWYGSRLLNLADYLNSLAI